MQKIKKALKKLAHLGTSRPSVKLAAKSAKPAKKSVPAAQAAKKAPAAKKKSQPAHPPKKAAGKKPAAKEVQVIKKSSAPKASAALKPQPVKDVPKKKAPVAASPAPKAAAKAPEKHAEKSADKGADRAPTAEKGEKKYAKKAGDGEAPKKSVEKSAEKITDKGSAEETQTAKPAKARKSQDDESRGQQDAANDAEVVLTDAEGRRYCRVKDCDQIASVDGGYCRYHYLLYWRNIQNRKKILSEGKLERYIEELTARYPDKYLELLRKDLRSEKDFMAAIQELEIDDSGVDTEFEDEAQSYLDEVRGMGSEPANDREEDF